MFNHPPTIIIIIHLRIKCQEYKNIIEADLEGRLSDEQGQDLDIDIASLLTVELDYIWQHLDPHLDLFVDITRFIWTRVILPNFNFTLPNFGQKTRDLYPLQGQSFYELLQVIIFNNN